MDVKRELSRDDDEARLVGRLAVAYTLLTMAPYTARPDFAPGDMAAYVVKQAKKNGSLGKLQDAMGVEYGQPESVRTLPM